MPSTRRKNKRDSSAVSGDSSNSNSGGSNPPKRKSKSTKTPRSAKALAPKKKIKITNITPTHSSPDKNTCLLIHLLNQIDTLSLSKSKAVAAIQSISKATIIQTFNYNNEENSKTAGSGSNSATASGSAKAAANNNRSPPPSSNKKDTNTIIENTDSQMNANLIIITTHILSRIMIQLNNLSTLSSSTKSSSVEEQNDVNDQQRHYAMVLSIYASRLVKILLADKPQLERTINSTSSSNRGGSALGGGSGIGTPSGSGLGGIGKEEGLNARSILSRAILTSMLAILKSMSVLSTANLPPVVTSKTTKGSKASLSSEHGIYAKLMWVNANSLETLLALGSNYRVIRGGNTTKGNKSSSTRILGNTQTTLLSTSIMSATGGVATGGSSRGNDLNCGIMNDDFSAVKVHNMNMDVRCANEWNEICSAMEKEDANYVMEHVQGGGSGGISLTNTTPILQNDELVYALKTADVNLFDTSSPLLPSSAETGDGEAILNLITYEHSTNKKKDSNDNSRGDDNTPTKPPSKKQRTESPTSASTATRTRSKTLSDKKKNVSNEYTTLSSKVSDVLFSCNYNHNTTVFGGNRFNLKKWSSSAFIWTCNGQGVGLKTLRNIFQANSTSEGTNWDDVMNLVTVVTGTSTTRKKTGKGSSAERKRATNVTSKGKDNIIHIPGNLVLVTYASRIIDIISEGGKLGVSSLQRNGGEEYVKLFNEIAAPPVGRTKSTTSTNKSRRQSVRKNKDGAKHVSMDGVQADVVMSSGSKGKSHSGSTKAIQHKRSDIRNLSILVMELLLVAHQKCISSNVAEVAHHGNLGESFKIMEFIPKFPLEDDEKLLQILLNDEDNAVDGTIASFSLESKKDSLSKFKYFPLLHKTLDTLTNCATSASMSIGNIDDCGSRLTGIGAALALKYSTVVNKLSAKETNQHKKGPIQYHDSNTVVVADAKLSSWAINHFSATLTNIISSSKQINTEGSNYDVVDELCLKEPLSLNQKEDRDIIEKQYLGLFADSGESQGTQNKIDIDNQTLAFFMRASSRGDNSEQSVVKDLIHSVLRIVICCYSLNTKSNMNVLSKRNTYTRSTLAADCIDALRKCFTSNPLKKSAASLQGLLRRFSFDSPRIICSIVELGHLLEQNMIQSRVKIFGYTCVVEDQEQKSASINLPASLRLEFEQWERRLWSSHVKLCLVIGRGSTAFDPSINGEEYTTYLGTFSNKKVIFKAVATMCSDDNNDASWPLYLPSIHHSIVTTCLLSDPIPKSIEDAAAEHFICNMMLSSINAFLAEPSFIVNKTKESKKINIQVSDEEVFLSLRDTRLFILCLSRLPKEDQQAMLSKLLTILSAHLGKGNKDGLLEKLITAEKDCASFLARVISMTSIMIDIIAVGHPLLHSLARHIGSLRYYLPSIVELDSESELDENDWYRSESCFMGLWEEWESSALPPVEMNNITEPLSGDELKAFQSILEAVMGIGFDSAPEDRCHLLFAAWNASAKLCCFDPKLWEGPTTAENFMKMSVPLHLFSIRDDICNLVKGLDPSKKYEPDSLLSKYLKRKELQNTALRGRSMSTKSIPHLKCALSSNNEMLRNLLKDKVCDFDSSPSSATFALLESSVAYTSFLMAIHTTSSTDLISAIIPRDKRLNKKRKGSSVSGDSFDDDASEDSAETEGGYNDIDDDDDDEIKADGITRFHEICEELGAAPVHPDWLDVACRFRTGIDKSTAIESAEMALNTLTEFGTKIYERFLKVAGEILSLECEAKNDTPLGIILGMVHDSTSSGWAECIADVFNLDVTMVGLFETGLTCKNLNGVKEAWAPNSAHRLKGKLQNTMSVNGWALSGPELRAGSEWEILLADSLLGACSDVDYDCCSAEIRNNFRELLKWSRLLQSTVSAIVTASALLQFSLNNGKGQHRHNISDHQSSQMCKERWFQKSPMRCFPSPTDFSSMKISSSDLEKSISKSLCFLSDVHACGALSIGCQLSAQAAIGHLVGDEIDLRLLTGQKQIRNLLNGLHVLSNSVQEKEDICNQNINGIVEKLFCSNRCISGSKYFQSLLFCLGSPIDLTITTLLKPGASLNSVLKSDCDVSVLPWEWGQEKIKIVEILVLIMQGKFPTEISGEARLKVIETVREMLIVDYKNQSKDSTFKKCLLDFWNKANVDEWKEIVMRDICLRDEDVLKSQDANATVAIQISQQLSYTIALLLGNEEDGTWVKAFLDILLSNTGIWLMNSQLDHVLYLLSLTAICLGSIEEVGRNLLNLVEDDYKNERRLSILEMFYRYLCESRKVLISTNDKTRFKDGSSKTQLLCKDEKSLLPKVGENRQCTFVTTHGEYTEQHWYNCYTCGLIWDKGCCSLCAQVCHKGHDVGYSRKSSFYCDCGAPGESDSNYQRVPCKCLAPISDETQATLERDVFNRKQIIPSRVERYDTSCEFDCFWHDATEILASIIPGIFRSSLDGFIASIHSGISEKLFDVFNENFELLNEKQTLTIQDSDIEHHIEEDIRNKSMTNRNGHAADLAVVEEQVFSPIRIFKASSICTRISTETSTDRLKKSIVTKNNIERKIMVADRRGRIIIYEPSLLIFCGGFPLANVRHKLENEEIHQQRADLCVLGSSKIKCNVVGLTLNPEDDSRLAAWGVSDAFVFFVSDAGDKIEYAVELEVGLDIYDCETDYVVKVEWVIGSSCNVVVVFCATSVKVFNLKNVMTGTGGELQCQPSKIFSFGYEEVVLRSGTIIPTMHTGPGSDKPNKNAKIGLMFDTGRLHFIDLTVDCDENVDIEGNLRILGGDGFSFPIEGVRQCNSSTKVGAAGETAKTLGEGSHLEYLHQSKLLLYKCASSPVMAFTLDEYGQISGSFEFLPHLLNKEMLGTLTNGHSVTGPYTHWIELGIIQRDGSYYHRVVFSGRSTRMNQSKMIYMEYNDEGTKICEVKSTSSNFSLGLNSTFEGTAAFMTPVLGSSEDGMVSSGSNNDDNTFTNRIILASVTSNGSLMIFGESSDVYGDVTAKQQTDLSHALKRQRAFSDSILTSKNEITAPTPSAPLIKHEQRKNKLPKFPLTIFEELINLSEKPEVVFGGDAVKDSDATKRRLSINSGEFMISPCKSGCTLTVSLQDQHNLNKNDFPKLNNHEGSLLTPNEESHDKSNTLDVNKLAIVAVRVLLGSTTTDYLPKTLTVMGRQINLAQRMKRWYDIPLTEEEIMLAVRSGVVTIGIGSSCEAIKSPPIIDSFEVYALEREKLPHLFLSSDEYESSNMLSMEGSKKSLDVSILTITHLCNLLGKTVDLSSQINKKTLQRLIQVTALDTPGAGNVRDNVVDLVKSVEKDPLQMQMTLDEGTLHGVSQTLEDLLCSSRVFTPTSKAHFIAKTRDCLNVALAIARDRPVNYKSCVEKLISLKQMGKSITLQAKEVLDAKEVINVEISTKLVQLCIFEYVSTDGIVHDSNFASLEFIGEMLRSKDERTVIESCTKLAETLKELQTLGKVQAYKCDGCGIFPITNTRYTLEDKNIDLCEKCFQSGKKFAEERNFLPNLPALIDGSQLTMEDNKVMTCSQLSQMTTKPVPPNICEQVEEAKAMVVEEQVPENLDDEEEALNKAIQMSMEIPTDENSESESQRTSPNSVHIALLNRLLEDLEQALLKERESLILYPIPIVDLLLTIVVQSDLEDRITFGKMICESFCSSIFSLCERYLSEETNEASQYNLRHSIIIYLRAIEGLATKQKSITGILSKPNTKSQEHKKKNPVVTGSIRPNNKDKTDPRFVCEVHGVPAVRRRCSHGENKDRRFYVCGMDRKNRCKYFRWADAETNLNAPLKEVSTCLASKNNNISYDMSSDDVVVDINPKLQIIIWDIFNSKKQPLQQRLCSLLKMMSKKLESQKQGMNSAGETISENLILFRRRLLRKKRIASNVPFSKSSNERNISIDLRRSSSSNDSLQGNTSEYSIVESTLDLLSKIAMNALKKTLRPQSSWESWFELLCEIISSSSSAHLRSQARKMMRKLCGGRNSIYQQIRDQYVFGFQFMKLLHHSILSLEAALCVREKARKCGPQWRFTDLAWATLSNGGLIGTQQLISEDNYPVMTMDELSKILDDLISTAESRGMNWKHFCSLDKMPQKSNLHPDLCDRSPVCLLFWMACSLPLPNQVKVFKLMEIAFGSMECTPILPSMGEDSTGIISVDGGTDGDGTDVDYQNEVISEKESPQQVLLRGASALSIHDVHAFVISFILNGSDDRVRAIARKICLQVLHSTPKEWIGVLLRRFTIVLVSDIGYYGCKSLEFLQFLVQFVSSNEIMANVDTSTTFKAVISYYTQQLKASCDIFLSSGKETSLIMMGENGQHGKSTMFDLSNCLHCSQLSTKNGRMKVSEESSTANSTASLRTEAVQRNMIDTSSDTSKRRLDSCVLNSVSTEFICYSQLKSRMTITEIHLNVSETRGRFVKTVGVYFTPRPVQDTSELKDPNYTNLWQRCGTLTLTRGGLRAVCKFTCPIIAANLKLEYEEFYDKNTSQSSSSGGFVIHCPRCTRVVNATHGGVCGNCGEVVFQCRKCRHINYDRLDAFLCVECGYCSSGSFTYDIVASLASKAVAITDDEGLDRAVRLMWLAGNKYNDCKGALLKILQSSKSLSGHKRSRCDLDASIAKLNGPLKRALLGDLPKVFSKKQEGSSNSKKKQRVANDNPDSMRHGNLTSGGGSSAASRARSLLNLAIQLRSESTGNEDRSSLGGVPDSLSRLVANITRGRSGYISNNQSNSIEDAEQRRAKPGDISDDTSISKMLQNCNKLYSQMRLAEREVNELRTRVIAWKRLNHDALAEHGRNTEVTNCWFTVSHCSSCSQIIQKHLLALIHVLFQKREEGMTDLPLSRDFVSALFDDSSDNDSDMNGLKRAMIIALATKSELGSHMVLNELKSRLAGSKCPICADILGHLLSVKGVKNHQLFVEFAMQTLQ